MATFAYPPPQTNHFTSNYTRAYSSNTVTSPRYGTPPSLNASPTAITIPPKQIHNHRHCGSYIPAALRPTEYNSNKRPMTPPRSTQSSLDSQASSHSTIDSRSLPSTPTDDHHSFIAPLGQVTRIVTDEWVEDLGNVTGAPTRGHWKPDSSTDTCASPVCAVGFSFLARRHHCRRCGNIFCHSHSGRVIPLDQEARFHPKGSTARACDDCWNDFKIWQHDRKSRTSSINSGGSSTPVGSFDSHMKASDYLGIKPRQQPANQYGPGNESVPDYNWSTF